MVTDRQYGRWVASARCGVAAEGAWRVTGSTPIPRHPVRLSAEMLSVGTWGGVTAPPSAGVSVASRKLWTSVPRLPSRPVCPRTD